MPGFIPSIVRRFFDAQKDDSHIGRWRVERRKRDFRLRLCDRVAAEQKFSAD